MPPRFLTQKKSRLQYINNSINFFGLANGNTGIVLTALRAKIKGFIPGGRRITPLLSANEQQKWDKTLKVILFKEFLSFMAKNNQGNTTSNNYNERRWSVPSRRAKNYAEERKAKVHQRGAKMGRELTDYEAGMRSGYLQCQSDHAGVYKYKKALSEGKSKEEAKFISRQKGRRN